MSKLLKRVVVRYGARICAIAAMVATISPVCCRGQWYQPEEPDGIREKWNSRKGKYYEEKNEFVKEKNSNISDSWSDGDIGRSGNGKCCKSR